MRPTLDRTISARRPVYFQGTARLMAFLTSPTPGEVRAVVFGVRFELDLSDQIQRELYLGVYEPRETRWVRSFLRPGMTFVDGSGASRSALGCW